VPYELPDSRAVHRQEQRAVHAAPRKQQPAARGPEQLAKGTAPLAPGQDPGRDVERACVEQLDGALGFVVRYSGVREPSPVRRPGDAEVPPIRRGHTAHGASRHFGHIHVERGPGLRRRCYEEGDAAPVRRPAGAAGAPIAKGHELAGKRIEDEGARRARADLHDDRRAGRWVSTGARLPALPNDEAARVGAPGQEGVGIRLGAHSRRDDSRSAASGGQYDEQGIADDERQLPPVSREHRAAGLANVGNDLLWGEAKRPLRRDPGRACDERDSAGGEAPRRPICHVGAGSR
jgi:hypothetical protein